MKEFPPVRRSRIESVLTALPVLMLVAGLYVYYSAEKDQAGGEPIVEESKTIDALFEGFSKLRSGGEGQHFLWYRVTDSSKGSDTEEKTTTKGARLHKAQVDKLRLSEPTLKPDDVIRLQLAPTVSGSKTLWVIQLSRDGVSEL